LWFFPQYSLRIPDAIAQWCISLLGVERGVQQVCDESQERLHSFADLDRHKIHDEWRDLALLLDTELWRQCRDI